MAYDDSWKIIPQDEQEQANLKALEEYLNSMYYR